MSFKGRELSDLANWGVGSERESVRPLVIAGAILMVVSLFLPWFRLHADGAGETYSSLGGTGYLLMALMLAAIVLSLVTLFLRPGHTVVSVCVIAIGTVAAVVAGIIVVCEIVAAFIPTWFVPETFRRTLLDVSASYGAWAALIGAALVFLGIAGQQWLEMVASLPRSFGQENIQKAGVGLVGLTFCVVLLGWLRYQPWMKGSAGDFTFHLSGWATPWVGPATLVALGLLLGALVALVLGNLTLAIVLAGLGAWVFTFLAACVILGGSTLNLLPIDDYTVRDLVDKTSVNLPDEIESQTLLDARIKVQIAWAAWFTYLAALGAALSSIWLMHLSQEKKATT